MLTFLNPLMPSLNLLLSMLTFLNLLMHLQNLLNLLMPTKLFPMQAVSICFPSQADRVGVGHIFETLALFRNEFLVYLLIWLYTSNMQDLPLFANSLIHGLTIVFGVLGVIFSFMSFCLTFMRKKHILGLCTAFSVFYSHEYINNLLQETHLAIKLTFYAYLALRVDLNKFNKYLFFT